MEDGARILVVDDDRGKCELLGYLLEGAGYEVDRAHSDREALSKVQREPFDLVLANIEMPGTDGLEMVRRVREASGYAPVIVMAGYASLNAVIRAVRDDACDYLVNPLDDPDAILAAVESGLLERRGMLEPV